MVSVAHFSPVRPKLWGFRLWRSRSRLPAATTSTSNESSKPTRPGLLPGSTPSPTATSSSRTSAPTESNGLRSAGKRGLFPIWGLNTTQLALQFINAGFEATLICVDPRQARPAIRRSHLRRTPPPRFSCRSGPLRRERRVPHLRPRGSDLREPRSPAPEARSFTAAVSSSATLHPTNRVVESRRGFNRQRGGGAPG